MALEAPTLAPTSSASADGMVRLPVSALRVPEASAVDVYCLLPGSSDPKLMWNRQFQLRDEHIAELSSRGFQTLWVTRSDALQAAIALKGAKASILKDPAFSPCERFVLLQFAASNELDAAYKMLKCRPYVECCLKIGPELIAALTSGKTTPLEFFQSRLRGPSPAHRFSTLAGYAALLAKSLGLAASPAELTEIAVGAMIHDVGIQALGGDLLNRSGRWSPEERSQFESHPQRSYEELLPIKRLSRGQLLMAYQHHEREDGSGFPVGILTDEIHPWAKLLAVVDRFDSLTVGRLSRRLMNLSEALDRLADEAGCTLDAEMTLCWISLLQTA